MPVCPPAELLIVKPIARRGEKMMAALAATAPTGSVATEKYGGGHRLLIVYGAGALDRQEIIRQHKSAGGSVVCVDLGYWNKEDHLRLSIGSTQPNRKHIYGTEPGGRWHPPLREEYSQDGPILLIAIGRKTRIQYGFNGPQWETAALRKLRERFPNRKIIYRPKGGKPENIDCESAVEGDIESVLCGASLVVCRHSNVAVDACIAGIPVECEDGAGYALYSVHTNPTVAQRKDFLKRLAWWQWAPHEAADAWKFLARWF